MIEFLMYKLNDKKGTGTNMKTLVLVGLLYLGSVHAETINYENEGNLQSFHDIGCTGLKGLTNQFTPADIYLGVSKCLAAGEYQKAGSMNWMASVYGKFDKLRVSEYSAHQALEILKMNYFSNIDQKTMEDYATAMKNISDMSTVACPTLKRIGKPDYHPVYMIQHGLKTFYDDPSNDGLVPDFNADVAWQDILDNYAKCSSANPDPIDNQQTNKVDELELPEETSESAEWFVTDFCLIKDTYYALMSDDEIHYATEVGGWVGYVSDPLSERCVFDLIIDENRYCVDVDGVISVESEDPLGQCEPCVGEQCSTD